MFWSVNYTANRELKLLLLEKNVTLTQVLEADDILQECKADYLRLREFLLRPDILSELITLITEEPPKNVDLSLQYRHANIACEVLTSNLSLLRDRLSSNAVQMNRLCDFVNREPPLNPLLASYFSKTIDMLLERSPKMDWYSHHIVCLRVLDFFKSRRDFVPNLLRHMSTSAICDTFRSFLQTITNTKSIAEWLDEYNFFDCLIQIICGTYDPEEVPAVASDTEEKATNEPNEKLDSNHNSEHEETGGVTGVSVKETETNGEMEEASESGGDGGAADERAAREERARRTRGVAAANAAALLCDSYDYVFGSHWDAGKELAQRLRSEETVRRLLQGCFTSPAGSRRSAVVHACRFLLTLLKRAPPTVPAPGPEAAVTEAEDKYREVERAVAPHLPLLHRALLKDVDEEESRDVSEVSAGGGAEAGGRRTAGAARVHVAALVARLALSDVDDVPTALISLGTAGVLIDLSFSCSHNNFLHAQLVALVRNARNNACFGERYTTHLIEECNLLTRLMDAFEENESGNVSVRAGYMGHVVLLLGELHDQPLALPPGPLLQRWTAFCEQRLKPLLQLHHAPLGGVYPQEDFQELTTYNNLEDGPSYDERRLCNFRLLHRSVVMQELHPARKRDNAFINFMARTSQQFSENVWDESPADEVDEVDVLDDGDAPDDADDDRLDEETQRVLAQGSPWGDAGVSSGALAAGASADASGADDGGGAEGWAQFDTPFNKYPFWAASNEPESPSLSGALQNLRVSDDDKDALTILLAHKMLAFHNMAPEGHHYDSQEGDTQTHIDHHGQTNEETRSDQNDQSKNTESDQNHSVHSAQIESVTEKHHQTGKDDQNQGVKDSQNQGAKEQNQDGKDNQNQGAIDNQSQGGKDNQNQGDKDSQNQGAKDNQNLGAKEQNQGVKDQNQGVKEQNQGAKDQNQSAINENQSTQGDQNQSDNEAKSAFDSTNADNES